MAQRPRPPSPQITWREVKSARRRPPLLRSRPGSPERPRRTTGAVRRRPRPTRTTCVSQCFSVQFFTFPVVSRPTRGLPVNGRVRNAFPNISVYATRPPGGRPRSFRSSPVGPGEVLRSTAALATIIPTVQCATRLHRASFPVVSRQTRGRPVDSRSRRALPIILTYDTTRLPRTSEFPVAGRPTRGLPVDCRHRNAIPDISVYDTPGVRRRAYTYVGEKAKTGRSVAVPRGLLEPFCEARGFFGRPTTRPPSPI